MYIAGMEKISYLALIYLITKECYADNDAPVFG